MVCDSASIALPTLADLIVQGIDQISHLEPLDDDIGSRAANSLTVYHPFHILPVTRGWQNRPRRYQRLV
jgi:hypothetical protein